MFDVTMNIIERTIQKYKDSLKLEIVIGGIFFLGLLCWDTQKGYSYLIGFLTSFIPFIFFVFFFFYQKVQNINVKRLYFGELFKILLTVLLIALAFITMKIEVIFFFMGYFFSLLLNNLLPFYFEKRNNHF